MARRSFWHASLLVAATVIVGSCAASLPDQDLRIVAAAPNFKLTADILWKDVQADRAAAERKYHGKVLLVTGVVGSIEASPPNKTVTFVETQGDVARGVQARLLIDTADQVLKGLELQQRISLKCFYDTSKENVILKSCTKP